MGDTVTDAVTLHGEALTMLCRVCACIISGYRRDVALCIDELDSAFKGVHFKNDSDGFHPKSLCRTCYSVLLNVKKRDIISSQVVVSWKPHTKDGSCKTFQLVSAKNVKVGRPKKKKSPGRPSKVVSVTDIMQLDASKHIPPEDSNKYFP